MDLVVILMTKTWSMVKSFDGTLVIRIKDWVKVCLVNLVASCVISSAVQLNMMTFNVTYDDTEVFLL